MRCSMKSRSMCLLISLLFPLCALAGQLGVNIDLGDRGGTFIDIVKEGYRWGAVGDGTELVASQVDSLGWPKVDAQYVVDYRPVAEWSGSIDDPQTYRIDASGTYKCSFLGKAAVRGSAGGAVQNASYDSSANITTFDFIVSGPPGKDHGLFVIEFKNTRRVSSSPAGSGFTHFRMYRPGYTLNATKVFTDQFIAALTGIRFSAIRFMDFTMTNGCDPDYPARTTWARRKHKEDASQDRIAPIGKLDGGAWEYIIELCNLVKMDPWINIPVSADSDYIANVAKLFRDSLSRNLHIYIESSNEVWNTAPGFEQSLYNQAEAKAIGIGEQKNHARRTVEIAKNFSRVFGNGSLNDKVRVILCSHKPMLKWWVAPMLDSLSKTFGPPKNYLYAIACQTYFSGGVSAGVSVDKILSNCHDDITKQIDETGKTDEAGRVQWIKLAKDSGLVGGFCSYEGGPDHGGGGTDNIANRIIAERDPRMGSIWTYNMDTAFFQLGGNLSMQFTLSSAYTRYGCWGLTDDIAKPDRNSKYKAAQQVAERYAAKTREDKRGRIASGPQNFSVFGKGKSLQFKFNVYIADNIVISLWNLKGQRVWRRSLSYQATGEHVVSSDDALRSGIGMKNNYLIAILTSGKAIEKYGFVYVR
jgi:hypothetical protein